MKARCLHVSTPSSPPNWARRKSRGNVPAHCPPDLDNYNNDTEDGLHITSMTGSWLAIVQGFAQMKTWGGKLSFAPFLPSAWTGYAFHINYRGRLIKVAVGKENVVFTLLKGEPLDLQVYGKDITLNGSHTVALEK